MQNMSSKLSTLQEKLDQEKLSKQEQYKLALELIENIETPGSSLQLSNRAIQNRIKILVPEAIKRLSKLTYSENDNVALGAIKLILAKTMPDLKAVEHSSKEGIQGLVIVQKDDNDDVIDAELVDVEQANSTD